MSRTNLERVVDRRCDELKHRTQRIAAAARWPALQKMLGNTPPTLGEIDRIFGTGKLPEGFLPPPRDTHKRYITVEYWR